MPDIIPNIHPMLVHFPIAFLIGSLGSAIIGKLIAKKTYASHWVSASHILLWLGVISAVLTAIFGWQAYNSVNHDEAGHVAMKLHMTWAILSLVIALFAGCFDLLRVKLSQAMGWLFIGLLLLISILVGTTAWLGAELVYRHGIGVISLPGMSEDGVGHEHGADHQHGDEHDHQSAQDKFLRSCNGPVT